MDRTREHTLAVEGAGVVPGRGPARGRSTLLTVVAVCVVAASLAVVAWVNASLRDAAADGRRYSVVETPQLAPPRATPASPQPLVPLLPPDPKTASAAPSPSRSKAPSARPSSSRPATPPATGPAGAVTGYPGKCLHVPGDNGLDGIPVEMVTCGASPGERWTMASDGTVRALGKCLEVAGGQTADGTRIQISACRGGPAQVWVFTAGRDLVNPAADKCLDVQDFNVADGAALQLWTCTGAPNQKWSIPA
jgi:ricin-type beta-trefoil lectin protein